VAVITPIRSSSLIAVAAFLAAASAHAETVQFTIDAAAQVKPISRFIYGINATLGGTKFPNLTARRGGGNRWTAYNWENNASNAGSDYLYENDDFFPGGTTPGGAIIPLAKNASANNAGLLLTIPIQGYVAADKKGPTPQPATVTSLKTRFRQEIAAKGSAFTLTPDPGDKFVYQDEFVNWVKTKYPYGQTDPMRPIWFSLDNEPDLWAETHPEVHPDAPTYAEMISKSTAFTTAIKAVAPKALTFGPVSYGWYGYVRLQGAPDAADRDFLSFYLAQMKAAGATAGKRLLDVLDLHWYPEVKVGDYKNGIPITGKSTAPDVVAARVQAPRSLWDPSYIENSWITHDWLGDKPIQLIPLMLGKIAANYPGTRLAFTEYDYGGGQDISGGIAQADALGIFGKYGVFAAMQWPLREGESFVAGAFKMYRDFDGNNASFGDISVKATTSSVADTSVYASLESAIANRMVIVAINKTDHSITGTFTIKHKPMTTVSAYKLTSASATPLANGHVAVAGGKFNYKLPAYSVSTLLLSAP
jgi:hypothetical protein